MADPGSTGGGARRSPHLVGGLLPKVAAKCFERHGFHAAEILLNWPAIVGTEIASFTLPYRVRWPKAPDRIVQDDRPAAGRGQKTALDILVEGGRAHEIPYRKRAILERINAYFGYRAVTDVHPISAPLPRNERPRPLRRPSEAAVAAQRKALPPIADDGLAQALARLGANVAARKGR